jgi:SAM-dependent methyltransferase
VPSGSQKFPADAGQPVGAPAFWEDRYKVRDTAWDLAMAAPPLRRFFSSPAAPVPPARVLVPGCGKGHDALFLAKLGFRVLAVDFARQALDALRRRRRNLRIPAGRCRTMRSDVLHLPPRLAGAFDVLVEHTCFCAIDPGRRPAYVTMAAQVLVPGGVLVGLFYPFRPKAPGPPFAVSEEEIRRRFGPHFDIQQFETPPDSVERRRGEERLAVMLKK